MTYLGLIVLVLALIFAAIEAYKGSTGVKPTNLGWAAIALLIISDLFFHGQTLISK